MRAFSLVLRAAVDPFQRTLMVSVLIRPDPCASNAITAVGETPARHTCADSAERTMLGPSNGRRPPDVRQILWDQMTAAKKRKDDAAKVFDEMMAEVPMACAPRRDRSVS